MSGFENFESSDNWLNRFKNFLITERSISPEMTTPTSSPTCDFEQEFQKTLVEKCPPFKLYENKENFKPNCTNQSIGNKKLLNDSIMPMSPIAQRLETTANDSFFYLERICNKSVSDPDSTIYSYVENMKKETSSNSNNTTSEDEENAAIKRLLNDERTIFHVGDQTQLGDIEEPSGLWENTISDETLLKMSPTKRVGLLRPSTIMEEPNSSYSESENSKNNSSVFSFKTAMKYNETENSKNNSSVFSFKTAMKYNETTSYETANDTIHSEISKKKDYTLVNEKYIKYDENFLTNKNKIDKDSAYFDSIRSVEQNKTDSLDSEQFSSKNTLDDVSSLIDDDSLNNLSKNKINDKDSLEVTLNKTNNNLTTEKSYIEISDEEDNLNYEENVLNEGFSLQLIDDENNTDLMDQTLSDSNGNGLNASLDFNDTLEEVDYILKQGIKMMNNTTAQPVTIKNTTANSASLNVYTPSPRKSPKTPNTVISKQFCIKKTPCTPSTIEKNEIFKRPGFPAGSRIPQPKSLNYLKKSNQYSNVISPVGAYIKNTPKTPIVSNIRETTVRTLDYGQIGKQQIEKTSSKQQIPKFNNTKFTSSLPKKAYQSSEYREFRDERTPLNIPGGNKIHKYLQSALLPAVARHEGKMKLMKSSINDSTTAAAANRTVDSSMADLSIMSGDVSLYTIRDAQTFGNSAEHK